MSKYNNEYFFVVSNRDEIENLPEKDFIEDDLSILSPLPKILFDGVDIIVTTDIRRELLRYNISNIFFHPAVYIHDDSEWYEDYWFLTFVESFDCWDRQSSKYMNESFDSDEDKSYAVTKFSLDENVLDNVPLEKRLLFKMGGDSLAMITCHESIKRLFENDGSQTIPVAKW